MNMKKRTRNVLKAFVAAVTVAAISYTFTFTNTSIVNAAKTATKTATTTEKTTKTTSVKKAEVKKSSKVTAVKTSVVKKSDERTGEVNDKLLSEINSLRASKGLGALKMDSTLVSIAGTRSEEASEKWSHERPNGEQGIDMIDSTRWRGENLSYVVYPGYEGSEKEQDKVVEKMFDSLVASPTHYDNMVFGNFTKIGIATDITETSEGTKLTTAYMFSN